MWWWNRKPEIESCVEDSEFELEVEIWIDEAGVAEMFGVEVDGNAMDELGSVFSGAGGAIFFTLIFFVSQLPFLLLFNQLFMSDHSSALKSNRSLLLVGPVLLHCDFFIVSTIISMKLSKALRSVAERSKVLEALMLRFTAAIVYRSHLKFSFWFFFKRWSCKYAFSFIGTFEDVEHAQNMCSCW